MVDIDRLLRIILRPRDKFYELLAIVGISSGINFLTATDGDFIDTIVGILLLGSGVICHFFGNWVAWIFKESEDQARDTYQEYLTTAVGFAMGEYEKKSARLAKDLLWLSLALICFVESFLLRILL